MIPDPQYGSAKAALDDTAKRWYLVYTKPRAETVAEENLVRQSYESYLPMMRITRKRGGRLVDVVEPMFPRYLFIRLDRVRDNWAPIRSTVGVTSVVRFGGEPALVPDELIDWLRSRENESGVQARERESLEPGQKVRVFEGPLKDFEGIVMARNSNERVVVLLEIMGKATRVAMDPSNVVTST